MANRPSLQQKLAISVYIALLVIIILLFWLYFFKQQLGRAINSPNADSLTFNQAVNDFKSAFSSNSSIIQDIEKRLNGASSTLSDSQAANLTAKAKALADLKDQATWKQFISSSFSFKYPGSWLTAQEKSVVILKSTANDQATSSAALNFVIKDNPKHLSIVDWQKKYPASGTIKYLINSSKSKILEVTVIAAGDYATSWSSVLDEIYQTIKIN